MAVGSLLGTATVIAPIPFTTVRTALGEAGAPALLSAGQRAAGVAVCPEPAASTIWIQGSFWYQGEYRFDPHADGTQITYRIRNISARPDLAIRIWQRRRLKSQQRDLAAYATHLRHRLDERGS